MGTAMRTCMTSRGIRRATYAVSLLLFATAIGHVIVSGESKSHIKNLLYSPPGINETCGWWILAGDSNTREIETMMLKDLKQRRDLISFTDATYTDPKVANSQWRENKGNVCEDPRW